MKRDSSLIVPAVLALAVVAGVSWLVHVIRTRDAGTPAQGQPSALRSTSSNVTGTAMGAAPRSLAASASSEGPGGPEAVSSPTSAEETIIAFRNWTTRYLTVTDASTRHALAAEGVQRAAARRAVLREMIAHDPAAALQAALPWSIRQGLPPAVMALLERRVSGIGDFNAIGALPAGPADETFRAVRREAVIAGRTYEVFVFGNRAGLTTQSGIALHGIAIDGRLALLDSPVRPLDPGEPVPRGRQIDEVCSVSGLVAGPSAPRSTDGPLIAADLGDRVIYLCSAGHIAMLADELSKQEAATAAAGGTTTRDGSNAATAPASTTGSKRLLFIRVRFADQGASYEPQDEAGARATVADATAFLFENSSGLLSIDAAFTPVYTLPRTAAWYQSNDASGFARNVLDAARSVAADPSAVDGNAGLAAFNYRDHDLEVVRYSGGPGVFAGQAYVGARGCWLKSASGGVLAHELGHNLGLWHANTWNPTDPQTIVGPGTNGEYGDGFDTMGPASGGGWHFNTCEKDRLGWLAPGAVTTVAASGRWTLAPHDVATTGGTVALRLQRDADRDLWLEFRQHPVWASNRWLMNGVGLRWDPWFSSNGGTQLLDTTPFSRDGIVDSALVVGRTFSDPVAGVHITPVRRIEGVPAALEVEVQVGGFAGNRPPAVTLAPSTLEVPTGTAMTLSAVATDLDLDELSYAWDFGDRSIAQSVPAVEKSWSAAGDYRVRVTVSDRKGGTASASAVVRVGPGATGGRVFGVVRDERGDPVADVLVSNGIAVASTSHRSAWTDSNGNYVLSGVPLGSWTLAATRPGWTFVRIGGAAPVSVDNTTGLTADFVGGLSGYRIAGIVRTAEGTPVPGVRVSIGSHEEPTDANGAFAFVGLSSGTYTVSAAKEGMRFDPANVLLSFADATGMAIRESTFNVSGEVRGLPAGTQATVTDGYRAVTTFVEGSGAEAKTRFALTGVPAGTWHLRVVLAGESFSPANFLNPLLVSGDAGGLVLERDGARRLAISGRITDAGAGIFGANVSAAGRATTTDSRGGYHLAGIAAGSCAVRVSAAGLSFTPAVREVVLASADVNGQDFESTRRNAAPVFVQPATATTPLAGPFVELSALADDDGGARDLRYAWSAVEAAGPVSFTLNGANAAARTNARFAAAGAYRLRATATDASGASASSDLVLEVPQKATRLVLVSVPPIVTAGRIFQFTVRCFDQFGNPMPVPATLAWRVTAGGVIDETGLFTATGEAEGCVVSAVAGQVLADGRFSVVRPLTPPGIATAAQAAPARVGASLGTTLTVAATSEAGEASLTYTWSVIGGAPGPVAFLPNGTNTAKQAVARFSRSGDYTLRVVVRDAAGQTAESVVAVRVLGTMASWRNQYFSAAQIDNASLEGSVWGADADPDGDGVVNLLEYAFEMNPLVPGVEGLPKQRFVNVGGVRHLAIVFRRNLQASDLLYTPQATSDLETWESGLVPVGDAALSPCTYRDPRPAAGQSKRFLRVEVTVP